MKERFEYAEIRITQLRLLDAALRMRPQRLKRFRENEPDVNAGGVLFFSSRFSVD
jgi:hypothetical protein